MEDTVLTSTRRSLHAVAELVLAGPQWRASNKIRLAISPGGFRTVAAPELRVVGSAVRAGDQLQPIAGTCAELGVALGVRAGMPEGLYEVGSGMDPDDELSVDEDAVTRIIGAFALGDRALRAFSPDDEPVLWPEHFDVAIRVGEVNYGVSAGDDYLPEPYAYVGVAAVPADAFWNAPFGAARPVAEFADPSAVVAFFTAGREGAP